MSAPDGNVVLKLYCLSAAVVVFGIYFVLTFADYFLASHGKDPS